MKLDDVVAQRVGAYLLIVAAVFPTAVVLIDIAVAAAIVSRCVVVLLPYALYGALLHALFRSEIEIVLCHHS